GEVPINGDSNARASELGALQRDAIDGQSIGARSQAPIHAWEPTPEAFGARARARLARTGLHLDQSRRVDMLAAIFAELPIAADEYRNQLQILEALEARSGTELDHAVARRYPWALYQSSIFDINPSDPGPDHPERGLRVKPEYRDLDRLRLRLEQSLVYKVYELLPELDHDARARVGELLEIDDDRAKQLLALVEDYRRSQQLRGR